MSNRNPIPIPRWISYCLILGSVILTVWQVGRFGRYWGYFLPGTKIAGIYVGGLNHQETAQRLLDVYSVPIEIHYEEASIYLDPSRVGFKPELESLLEEAMQSNHQQFTWIDYWDLLWGNYESSTDIPLRASYSEALIHTYLREQIASRYDQPPTPAKPVTGMTNFLPGSPGITLDIDRTTLLIEKALLSPSPLKRVVEIPLEQINPPRPSFQNLEIYLKQTIQLSGFDGLAVLYLLDLQNAQDIHFAYRLGEDLDTTPDVAFTASSVIKIPIMISAFRRVGENPNTYTLQLIEEMIEKPGNYSTDLVMQQAIHQNRAPLMVSSDMKDLELNNTFLAGHFYPGSPRLDAFQTPSNQRADIDTDPDVYNQTTSSDIGMLLRDIYQCSQSNSGKLINVFLGEISQAECTIMITYLTRNRIGSLIEAGVPESTPLAHMHGWEMVDGIMYTLGDAGIVYSPGGDYVLVIFLYQPVQLIWDLVSELMADLSRTVYNYYSLPTQ